MIGYLRGQVFENLDGKLIVLSEGQGVGYSVSVPQNPSYLDLLPGKALELHVYTHVREDQLDLFGFASRREKDVFLTLLKVNGIGPKSAMEIMSALPTEELVRAIIDGDKAALTAISGIGKKTAERMVLELTDPFKKKFESENLAQRKSVVGTTFDSGSSRGPVYQDAKIALIGLGYRDQQVSDLLNSILAKAETAPTRAEDLVKTALRELM